MSFAGAGAAIFAGFSSSLSSESSLRLSFFVAAACLGSGVAFFGRGGGLHGLGLAFLAGVGAQSGKAAHST
jgi:hypothetical protein